MLILGLDTSTLVAGLALVKDHKLISKYCFRVRTSLSQELLPSINLILNNSRLNQHDLGSIAVASGPGSFTGLRIGIATAKSLSLALHIPVFGVPTFDAMVYTLPKLPYDICPMIDAKKKEIFAAVYRWEEEGKKKVIPEMATSPQALCAMIKDKTLFLGNGLEVFKDLILTSLGELAIPWPMVPDFTAEGVALLGSCLHKRGYSSQLISLKPAYFRRSEAEIKREERIKPLC